MAKDIREKIRDTYSELELQDIKRRLNSSNKNVTIKNATDDELSSLITRLDMETRAQELIRRLKRNSMSEAERYNSDLEVSTEVPVKDMYHYGILGMRWGKRKGSSSKSTRTESSDSKSAKKLKGKKISEMSNDELKKLNTRLQLEKQYKDLSPSSSSKGRKIVSQILGNVGKELATTIIKKQLTKKMESVIG